MRLREHSGEATLDRPGAFLDEAIRLITQIVALQRAMHRSGRAWRGLARRSASGE